MPFEKAFSANEKSTNLTGFELGSSISLSVFSNLRLRHSNIFKYVIISETDLRENKKLLCSLYLIRLQITLLLLFLYKTMINRPSWRSIVVKIIIANAMIFSMTAQYVLRQGYILFWIHLSFRLSTN